MEEYIKLFIDELKITKAENTIDSYKRDLKLFIEYMREKGINNFLKLSEIDFMMYFTTLEKQGKSNNSIIRYISVLKSFFDFLYKGGFYSKRIDFDRFKPKAVKHEGTLLSKREFENILNQIEINTDRGLRDKIILFLMYFYGLKATTILSIKIEDIDLNIGVLRTESKVLSLNQEMISLIKEYIALSRTQILKESDTNKLFVSVGNAGITRQGIWKIITKYKLKAGINKELTANSFHNSYKYHKIEN